MYMLQVFKRWLDECVFTRSRQGQRSNDSCANKSKDHQ